MLKSYVLLRLYDKLNEGESIRRDEVMQEYGISVSTFRRYIALLRNYYRDCRGKHLEFVHKAEFYRLKKS